MAARSTRFVILAGRHPAALLAGDEDLEQLQDSIIRAQKQSGRDWLLWLGDEIPDAVSKWASADKTLQLEHATPKSVEETLQQIAQECGSENSLVHLKVVVTAPLIFWNRDWWAVGTPRISTLANFWAPEETEMDEDEIDGYVFHLPTLLQQMMPVRTPGLPQVVCHVVFHEYRLWGSGAERLPLDLPEDEDFENFQKQESLKNVAFVRHPVPHGWTPAHGRPPRVSHGPKDRTRRREVLKRHRRLESHYSGKPCLVGSGSDFNGWSRKLKLLLRSLGIPRVDIASYERPIPRSRPGAVVLLRAEALDLSEIDQWLDGLPRKVPICLLDNDEEETNGLEEWCAKGRSGEALVVDQALYLASMAADRNKEEWHLGEAVDDVRDALLPDGDQRVESVWDKIREQFGAVRVGETTGPIEIGNSVERLLQESPRELLELVVRTYDEQDELFDGEGRHLHLRSTPRTCLNILGTLDSDVPLVDQTLPAEPSLSVHVSDSRLAAMFHDLWIEVFFSPILEGESRKDAGTTREHLAGSSGLYLMVAIDGGKGIDDGEVIDFEQIRREISAAWEEHLPVLLLGISEADARRRLKGGFSGHELRRHWEKTSPRLAQTRDKLGYICVWNPWGETAARDLKLLTADEALENLAATGKAVEVRNRIADLLIEAYPDEAGIGTILATAGLKRQDFDLQGRVRDIWYRIVDDLGASGSGRLLAKAAEDPTVEGFHDQLRELSERLHQYLESVGADD